MSWYPAGMIDPVERVRYRMDTKTDKSGGPDACWPWTGARISSGYAHMSQTVLYGEMRRYPYGHRTAWALANGRWPTASEVVMHSCDNPPCVNPAHLSVGTPQENVDDRLRSGRWFGQGVGKLTEDQVRWARTNGLSQVVTAEILGVSQIAVSRLRRGKTYRDVL